MRNLKRFTTLFAITAGAGCAVSGAMIACGSIETQVTVDAGSFDADIDANRADGAVDGGAQDATIDVKVDAPVTANELPSAMAKTICQRIASCCLQTDAGVISQAVCEAQWQNGWELSTRGLRRANAANVTYDQAQATTCLSLLSQFSCGTISPAQYKAITAACFGAATGKLAAEASGCKDSVECVSTAFCDMSNVNQDGGAGTCKALSALGAGCATNESCSYRGTGAFCDPIDPNTGAILPNATCVDTIADGNQCRFSSENFNKECTSGLCGDGNCGTGGVLVFPSEGNAPGLCESYRGDGG